MNSSIAATEISLVPLADYSGSSIAHTIYREVNMGYAPVRKLDVEKTEQNISIQPAWFTFINPLEFE